MTGTALTEAQEFDKIYKLDVISIPPNMPMIRDDLPDLIYRTTGAKFNAVVEEIKVQNETGVPVLVGTSSVETSEYLSNLLDKQGVPHHVLNAKHHEREAQIVAQAGRSGAVTIATNMAGRGTDIVLGGNPAGYFDSILRRHAERVDYIRDIPETTEDERAEKEEAIRQYIESMTEEERNELFEQKIRECEEDHESVVALGGLHIIGTERHESRRSDNQLRGRSGRQADPGQSHFFLALDDELMRRFAADRVAKVMEMVGMEEELEKLFSVMETWVHVPEELIPENIHSARREDLKRKLIDLVIDHYEEQGSNIDKLRTENPGRQVETLGDLERIFTLQVLDRLWMDHIDALAAIRPVIDLPSYGHPDPPSTF